MPIEDMRNVVDRFASRDFGEELMTERFSIPELRTASAVLLGGYINGLLAAFESPDPETAIDQTAVLLLRLVGIPAEEAADLAHKPLPYFGMLQ